MRRSLIVVWLTSLILSQAIASESATKFRITGHYAEIRPNDVDEGNDSEQAEKIQKKLAEILNDSSLIFELDYFEIHGRDVDFPSAIFYGNFTLSNALEREDIVNRINEDPESELFFLAEIDGNPLLTRRASYREIKSRPIDAPSICNYGVMLPNETCICNPYVSGDKCDNWMCVNYGISDVNNNGRCSCPPGFVSAHCEIGDCKPALQSAFNFAQRTFILVLSQRDTIALELSILMNHLNDVLNTINSQSNNAITNYILTGFRQSDQAYYMETQYFETPGAFIYYLKHVGLSAGTDTQPIINAISESQRTAAKMKAMSSIFALTDALDTANDTTSYDRHIARTITWRNKVTIILPSDGTINTADVGFTVLQDFATATHGDLIILARGTTEINTITTQIFPILIQNENIHVKYASSSVDPFDVQSDDANQQVFALISVSGTSTLPDIKDNNNQNLVAISSGKQFAIYNFTQAQTPKVRADVGNAYNLRVFVISIDTSLVTHGNIPSVDAGMSTSFNQIGENSFAATTITNAVSPATQITLSIIDPKDGVTQLRGNRIAFDRTSSCSFPFIFNGSVAVYSDGGAYVKKISIPRTSGGPFVRVVPGYSIAADGHANFPFECFNGGSRTSTTHCTCAAHWTGPNCGLPICENGGTVQQFPSNDVGPCICPVGFGGDFCEQLSCFSPSDIDFSFKNRTIAMIVQNTASMSGNKGNISDGVKDMLVAVNGTGMFTNYLLTTFHLETDESGNLTAVNKTSNYGMVDDFFNGVANIDYSNNVTGLQNSLDSLRYAIDTGFVYAKSSVILFTDSAPNSTYQDDTYTSLAVVAIQLELEISIILTPPNGDKQQCPSDASIYYLLARETGGIFLNLCQNYNGDYNANPIRQFYSIYGPSHINIQNLDALESALPSAEMLFFVEDNGTEYHAYINSATLENFTITITNKDTGLTNGSLASISGLPFVGIFKLPQLDKNTAGYTIQFDSPNKGSNDTAHYRLVIRSYLSVFTGFSDNPAQDHGYSYPIWKTPLSVVAHISTQLSSPPLTVRVTSVDAFGGNTSTFFDASPSLRDESCCFEYYFIQKYFCQNRYDSVYLTAQFKTPEATIMRTKRMYCYLAPDACCNGGTFSNGVCSCDISRYDGRFCEDIKCNNGGTNINNQCLCPTAYTGPYCEDLLCTDSYNYEVASDDYVTSYQQITIVLEATQLLNNVKGNLVDTLKAVFSSLSTSVTDTQRHYSLILFDEKSVRRVITTVDQDDFILQLIYAIMPEWSNAPTQVKTMEAVAAAHSGRVRNWHQILVFTATPSNGDSEDAGKAQIYRTQVNFIYLSSLGIPTLPDDPRLLFVARQSGGRVLPIQYTALRGLIRAFVSMVQEMALVIDDGFQDCTSTNSANLPVYTSAESDAQFLVLHVVGDGIADNDITWIGNPNQTHTPVKGSDMVIFKDTGSFIMSINLTAQSFPTNIWSFHAVANSGSCYIQARLITNFNVRMGFTSDPAKDHVKNLPFVGMGSNSSFYTTVYYSGAPGDIPDLLEVWITDESYPWLNRILSTRTLFHWRDYDTCATTSVSDLTLFNSTFPFQRFILTGKDANRIPYQRIYFYKSLQTSDTERCQSNGGTPDVFGECICDTNRWGDFCEQSRCQNGGTPTRGVCDCISGFYGNFCEQKIEAPFDGTTQAIVTIPSTAMTTAQTSLPNSSPSSSSRPPTSPTLTSQASQTSPASSTSPASTPSATTTNPSNCNPTVCNVTEVHYLISHMIDATNGSYMTDVFQPLLTQLAGDMLGTESNTRFIIGGGNIQYFPYQNNITQQSEVATAIQYITNISDPGFTGLLIENVARMFINSSVEPYDYATETPPIFIFFMREYPLAGNVSGYGFQQAVNLIRGKGYSLLGVNMNTEDTNITSLMNQYLGECYVREYNNDASGLVNWLKERFCTYKWNNTIYTSTPSLTTATTTTQQPAATSVQSTSTSLTSAASQSPSTTSAGSSSTTAPPLCDITNIRYMVSHMVDATNTSLMSSVLQPLLKQLAGRVFPSNSNSRFVIGGGNDQYTPYNGNVTSPTDVDTAMQNIISSVDSSSDLCLNNIATNFSNNPIRYFDNATEYPPIFIFYLYKSDETPYGFQRAFNIIKGLNYTSLGVNMDPNNADISSKMSTYFGSTHATNYTNVDNTVMWILQTMCTIKRNNNPSTTTVSPSGSPTSSLPSSQLFSTSTASQTSNSASVTTGSSQSPNPSQSSVSSVSSASPGSSLSTQPGQTNSSPSSLSLSTSSQSSGSSQTSTPFTPTTTPIPTTTACKDLGDRNIYIAHLMDASKLDADFLQTEFPNFANSLGTQVLTDSNKRFVFAGMSGSSPNDAVLYNQNITSRENINDAITFISQNSSGGKILISPAVTSFLNDASISDVSSTEMPGIVIISLYWGTQDGIVGCQNAVKSLTQDNKYYVLGAAFGSTANSLINGCLGNADDVFVGADKDPAGAADWVVRRICQIHG